MKQLYFVRHGESEFNRAHKWAGSTDTPLTETGHKQAQKAGRHIKDKKIAIDVIVSSPLERAHETAKHIADAIEYPHEKIILHDALIERNYGVLEGNKNLMTATRYLLDESSIDHYENIEKLEELQARINSALEYLKSLPHETVLVVGHGASGRALRRAINNDPLHVRGKSFANAEIVRLI